MFSRLFLSVISSMWVLEPAGSARPRLLLSSTRRATPVHLAAIPFDTSGIRLASPIVRQKPKSFASTCSTRPPKGGRE